MATESEQLLLALGVNKFGLDAAYLQVLEILGTIVGCAKSRYNSEPLAAKHNIFWKAIREIADQEINKDDSENKNRVLSRLLKVFPNKKKKLDGRMWLPMHFAMASSNVDLHDIQVLIEHHPDLMMQSYDNNFNVTPFHQAVMMKDPNMKLIEKLKVIDPGYGARLTTNDSTPLHMAAEFTNSVAVIHELIQLYPPALDMRNEDQRKPLSCSLSNESPEAPDILQLLLDVAPHTAQETGISGLLPLHELMIVQYDSCPNSRIAKMASILLRAYPEAVNIPDAFQNTDNSWLPIHDAANNCGVEVLRMITEVNPANLSYIVPNFGSVAHFAARGGMLDNLRYIQSVMPELLYVVDDKHCTPLCTAVSLHLNNPDFIQAVASLAPDAAMMLNAYGNNLLHTMVSKFNVFHPLIQTSTDSLGTNRTSSANKLATMKFLLRLIPGGALAVNNKGQTPYDILKANNPFHYDARRLLLLAGAPSLHPETRQQMNYQARKGALLAFFASRRKGHVDVCYRIHNGAAAAELMREIVSFL